MTETRRHTVKSPTKRVMEDPAVVVTIKARYGGFTKAKECEKAVREILDDS